VADALRRALPGAKLRYLADSACAPYGEKSPDFIRARSLTMAQHLVDHGARLLVIACNTATAHAAEAIRAAHPGLPVVGIEPGVKPAVSATRNGRVGVLATKATLQSERFRQLIERHASGVQVAAVACSGVVAHIEAGDLGSEALLALVQRYARALREAGVDTALWRRDPESNRARRICNPLHNRFAIAPQLSCIHRKKREAEASLFASSSVWSGKRGSNSRPQPWQGCALPTELFPRRLLNGLRFAISED
jgi:hypothetical protein